MKLAKIAAALAVIMMMTVLAAPAVSAEDSVDLTATVLEPKPEIGIELSTNALNFGSLYPGNTSDPQDLKVTNIGLKEIDVTATASDDSTEPLFVPGLLIDNAAYGDYLATLIADEFDDAQLALHVPDDYASRGAVSGGAIFWAEEHQDSSPVEDFTYTSDGSSVAIIGYIGPGGNVIVPSVIEGLPVTSISRGAFYKNIVVTSVTIPDSVSKIDDYTFLECISLTSVTIPDSVTSIGISAFRLCTSLTSVTIPGSVTSIGTNLFFGCTALTSVTIGSGVTTINGSAFLGCSALTSVTIPDSVTSIGVNAFQDCTALTTVTIGNGVTSIGTNAFGGCSALTVINVDVDNNAYASIDNVLYDKAINTLILCPARMTGSLTIPDSVTSIENGAFRGCTALTSVTIPDSVTSIENGAFRDCTALTSVTIGSGVTSINGYTFSGCSALTSMTFNGNATTVGGNWATNVPSTMIVYYHVGATGFTNPWNGFTTVELP